MTGYAGRGRLVLLGLFALSFLAEAIRFAGVQDVWIDESTQLSGAMLPVPMMLRWLAGYSLPLGVPPDRMPPISYLVDVAGMQGLGLTVFGLRLLHLAFALGGLLLIVATIDRRFGRRCAGVATLLVLLSPRLIESAVELRAYPIFLALTCVQIAVLVRILDRPVLLGRPLVGFAMLGLIAIYTHFFALVATSAFFVGLAVARLRSRRDLMLLAGTYTIVLIGSVGLTPFIMGSAQISGAEGGPVTVRTLVGYLLRLIGHSSTMLSLPAALLTLGGFVLLLALSLGGFLLRLRSAPRVTLSTTPAALWAALLAGLLATVVAAILASGFNALKPTYSLWTLPVFILLASPAVAAENPRWLVRSAVAATALFAVGGIWSTGLFIAHADWFAHGPEQQIADELGPSPDRAAIIYTSDAWPYPFFPLTWRYANGARQWWRDPSGGYHKLLRGGSIDPQPHGLAVFANDDRLLFADVELHSYTDLRELLAGIPLTLPGTAQPPTGFTETHDVRHDGIYGLELTTFQRNAGS